MRQPCGRYGGLSYQKYLLLVMVWGFRCRLLKKRLSRLKNKNMSWGSVCWGGVGIIVPQTPSPPYHHLLPHLGVLYKPLKGLYIITSGRGGYFAKSMLVQSKIILAARQKIRGLGRWKSRLTRFCQSGFQFGLWNLTGTAENKDFWQIDSLNSRLTKSVNLELPLRGCNL